MPAEQPTRQADVAICEVALHRYALPYLRPIRWESGVEDCAEFLLLHLKDALGREGVAEVVAKPGWNGFDTGTMAFAFERLLLPAVRLREAQRTGYISRLVEMHAPKALLENAFADLVSPGERSAVPVSVTLTRAAPDVMADEARELMSRYGFTALKVKGGQGFGTDIAAVKAVQNAAGANVPIYVDVNGAMAYEAAADYLRAMSDLGVVAVEDPYNLKPDPRLAALQEKSSIPIIVDFSLDGVSSAESFLALGAKGLSIKVSRFGMRKARAMANIAAKSKALTVTGLFGESQAGAVHIMDLFMALPPGEASLPAEATSFLLMREHVLKSPLKLSAGRVSASDGNLAALIDWRRVATFATAPARMWTFAA
jgi:L-alanine-DL-glutamate epimerase-like enolase superfamily enzyme